MTDRLASDPLSAILCFSTVDWDYLWHRPQVVMSRFGADGTPVLFVETLGLRSPRLRDARRIASRLRHGLRAKEGGRGEPQHGVRIFSPLILPFLNSSLARQINVRCLIPRLRSQLEQLSGEDPIIWVYLPTPTVLECIRQIPHRLLVYEVIDALAHNPGGVVRGYEQSEREILGAADLVIATSESLYQEKVAGNPNSHWIPSGVDEVFFHDVPSADEVTAIRGPRVGFFGTIDHRLDLDLIATMAHRHREWSFVLIGPARCDIRELEGVKNIHFLGPRPHDELPQYLRGFDALFLPYVMDDFTRHVYPAKIFECLATGKPVVSTALPSLSAFDDVVRLAEGREDFELAVSDALAEDDPRIRLLRVERARANSWESRYRQIRGHLDELLG